MVHTIAHFHLRDCIPLQFKINNKNKRRRIIKKSFKQQQQQNNNIYNRNIELGKSSTNTKTMNNLSSITKAFTIDDDDINNTNVKKLGTVGSTIDTSESNFHEVELGVLNKKKGTSTNDDDDDDDDDSTNVHDQLPNIEEYKTNVLQRVDKARLRFKVWCSISTIIIFLIIIVSVSVSSSNNNNKKDVIIPTGDGNFDNNNDPDITESDNFILKKKGSNPDACMTGDDVQVRFNTLAEYITNNGWSDMSTNAQREAVMYLANNDAKYCIDIKTLISQDDNTPDKVH
jgi:hypothetical protein